MANQRVAEFLQRIPKRAPARVAETISTAFAIVENSKEKIASVYADGRLSREGRDAKIAELMAAGPHAHMNQLKAGIERDLASIKSEREAMRRRVVEGAMFSEVKKSEGRMWLRGLPENERRQIHMTTRDPFLVESIATMPHYLSGIKADDWENFVSRVIEEKNFDRLVVLAAEETAFQEAESAIKVAEMDLAREIRPADVRALT